MRTISCVLAAVLFLSACKGRDQAASRDDGAPAAAGAQVSSSDNHESADDRAAEKLNDYVKGYNGLIGTFGLSQQFQQYLGQQVARKGVNDSVFINVGWMDNGLDSLKQARAIRGGPHDLDAAADPLIASLQQLIDRLKGLQVYYQTRGSLQDNFARGKGEDPLVIAEYRTALSQLQPLSDAIDRAQDRRDQAVLDARKASGDMVGYDAELALQKSKALMRLFHGAADLRNPAVFAKGDALVTQIQAALDDERAQQAKAKASHDIDHGLSDSMDATAADRLETFIGHYRDLKQSGTPFAYQMMVSSYNDAIQQNNFGQV